MDKTFDKNGSSLLPIALREGLKKVLSAYDKLDQISQDYISEGGVMDKSSLLLCNIDDTIFTNSESSTVASESIAADLHELYIDEIENAN